MEYYVYVIQEDSQGTNPPVKIGVAKDVVKRISLLQVGNPRNLKLIAKFGPYTTKTAAHEMEGWLHKQCSKWWLRGEWFSGRVLKLLGLSPSKSIGYKECDKTKEIRRTVQLKIV